MSLEEDIRMVMDEFGYTEKGLAERMGISEIELCAMEVGFSPSKEVESKIYKTPYFPIVARNISGNERLALLTIYSLATDGLAYFPPDPELALTLLDYISGGLSANGKISERVIRALLSDYDDGYC